MSRVSRQNLLRLVCAAALFFSGWLIISGLNRSSLRSTDAVPAGRSMAAGRRYATRPIEQIQVGDRVHARNPQVEQHERASWSDPDWQHWVHLSLTMPLDDGGELKVELLRPESWLLEQIAGSSASRQVANPRPGRHGREGSQRLVETTRLHRRALDPEPVGSRDRHRCSPPRRNTDGLRSQNVGRIDRTSTQQSAAQRDERSSSKRRTIAPALSKAQRNVMRFIRTRIRRRR